MEKFLQLILLIGYFANLLILNSNSSGVSVVHFETASNLQCKQISPLVNTLCSRNPSINFLKVVLSYCVFDLPP